MRKNNSCGPIDFVKKLCYNTRFGTIGQKDSGKTGINLLTLGEKYGTIQGYAKLLMRKSRKAKKENLK